eukprot:6205450-Pleurochrysis_carterae.AAC.1
MTIKNAMLSAAAPVTREQLGQQCILSFMTGSKTHSCSTTASCCTVLDNKTFQRRAFTASNMVCRVLSRPAIYRDEYRLRDNADGMMSYSRRARSMRILAMACVNHDPTIA